MILLRLISWPYLRKHIVRTLLTVAGIVLGVAVLVGMRMADQTALGAFANTVNKVAGTTQLQVTSGDNGFPEDVLERVQSVPGVRVASAVIEAVADTRLPGQGNLMILGVDMTGDRGLRDYDLDSGDEAVIDDPLVFLAQPDSLIVTREFATHNRLEANSRVPMGTMEGDKQFTVRGIMKAGGMASAFGGSFAIMDLYAAQKVFGRGRRFDRIDLAVKDGFTVNGVQHAVQSALGPGFIVEPPASRGAQFDGMLKAHRILVNFTSAFALLIGMFLIYNSFAIAVTQRRYEIGVLRALGATQRQIRTLFLMESAVEGLAGSAAGVALGILFAHGIMVYLGNAMEFFYGLPASSNQTPETDLWLLAGAAVLGVATSMFAAWLPAREAARVDPVVALQKGKYHAVSEREAEARRWAALLCAILSVVGLWFGAYRPLFYSSAVLAILAALLISPAVALWLMRMLRPLLQRLRPVEGALAADSLIQSPRRTSSTVAALMLSLTLVIGLASGALAINRGITGWLTAALTADLVVTASQNLAARTFHFPAAIGEQLKAIEGVAIVDPMNTPRIVFHGQPHFIVAEDLALMHRVAPRKITAGDEGEMYRLAAAGQGILASDSLAKLANLKLGDVVELPTPMGLLRLPIVGMVEDYSDPAGTLLFDRRLYTKYWQDDSANQFNIFVRPGADPAQVRQRILERLGTQTRLFVFTNQEIRDYCFRAINQGFAILYAQIVVAVLVAMLGIVNTLTVSITDRRRELGVLQAVGALRNQVRHTIWMEAVCVGLVGLLMGLALGAVYAYFMRNSFHNDVSGVLLPYVYPVQLALSLFPLILGAAFLAALGPAEAAVRGSLVEALEYE